MILLIPALLLFVAVPMVVKKKQSMLDDVNSRLQAAEAEVKTMQEQQNKMNDFDVNSEIKKVLGNQQV